MSSGFFQQVRKSQYVKLTSLIIIISLLLMFSYKHVMAEGDNKKGVQLENVPPGAKLTATLGGKHADITINRSDGPPDTELDPELKVTITFSKPLAAGKRSEALIAITNSGKVPVVQSTVDVQFSGKAIPWRGPIAGLKSLRLNAGIELLGGEEVSDVEIQWNDSGFKAQIVNDKEPSLEPLDSRRIRISFMPSRGGELSITADVAGQSPEGVDAGGFVLESAEIEKPTLELSLMSTDPESYARTEGSKLPLHKGNQITIDYFLWNDSKNADVENGKFEIDPGYGEILSLTSVDKKVDCPKISTPVETAVCKIPQLKAGDDTVLSVTILYQPPDEIIASVEGSGASAEDIYEIGADVDPVVHVKFDPDPAQKYISPGTVITAQFTVRNEGIDILEEGELFIYPPDENIDGPYIKELIGCKKYRTNRECYSGVYKSYPEDCYLDNFSFKNITKINATFSKITEKAVGEDIVIGWDLKMPAYSFKPSDRTRGSVAYKITPKFADLYIVGDEDLGESIPGEIEPVDLEIGNKGSVSQEQATLTIEINLTKSEEYEESINRKLQFPGGKNYLDWFKQPTVIKEDSDGKIITLKCRKVPKTFNRFDCDLGTLEPGEKADAYIKWDQELPPGVVYSYKAWFKWKGLGEGDLGGSLDDNNIQGSGRVVEIKAEILEDDAESTSQEPDGQMIIKTPRDGSKVNHGADAFGSFDSIPPGMEIWVYSWAPSTNRYWLRPARKFGETSGTWTVKGLDFGRPGTADIGFTYKFGVVLADQRTSDAIRKDSSGLVFLPDGIKIMDEIKVIRVGE